MHDFRDEYLLALSVECGWIPCDEEEEEEEEAQPSATLLQAAREWWEKFIEETKDTGLDLDEPDKYPLLAVMHSYLCDQHSTRGWSDGQTDFFFIETAEPEGWLLLTRSPNSITFVSDELYRKLPELNLEQEYKLVTEESGGWSFVFATSWEELLVYDVQDPEDSGCPIKEFLEADPDRALAIILSDEGGIDQWIGYNIALPGETPSWDTPQEPINWEGFEQFAEKLG